MFIILLPSKSQTECLVIVDYDIYTHHDNITAMIIHALFLYIICTLVARGWECNKAYLIAFSLAHGLSYVYVILKASCNCYESRLESSKIIPALWRPYGIKEE